MQAAASTYIRESRALFHRLAMTLTLAWSKKKAIRQELAYRLHRELGVNFYTCQPPFIAYPSRRSREGTAESPFPVRDRSGASTPDHSQGRIRICRQATTLPGYDWMPI